MMLVTGGRASGKRSYVASLGYDATKMSDGKVDGRPVVLHAEKLVSHRSKDLEEAVRLLSTSEVVCITEVGCGPTPAESEERDKRDCIGQLAMFLTQRAECVVRMVCGIPVVLKGSPITVTSKGDQQPSEAIPCNQKSVGATKDRAL